MLNALIQLGTLIYGMMINFVAPMAYGLHEYGSFIAQNAWVLLLYRVMFIIGEPLIRFAEPKRILASSLVLNALVALVFLVASQWFALGSPLLLAGYLMSASAMLAMQAMHERKLYVAFIFSESLLFLAAIIIARDVPLLRVMELSAGIPSVLCVAVLFLRGAIFPTVRELIAALRETFTTLPRIIGITFVMNLLMSALPVFLAPILSPREMGLFKIMVSVIQSAMSLFPASTQALLTSFVNHPRGGEFYRLLSHIAILYFAFGLLVLSLLTLLVPVLSPYIALIAVAPVFYHAILTERHLTARHHIAALIKVNMTVAFGIIAALCWVETLQQATLLYAAGFTLYALMLSLVGERNERDLLLLAAIALCPVVVYLMLQHIWVGAAYALLLMGVTCLRHVPTRAEVKLLWREL